MSFGEVAEQMMSNLPELGDEVSRLADGDDPGLTDHGGDGGKVAAARHLDRGRTATCSRTVGERCGAAISSTRYQLSRVV